MPYDPDPREPQNKRPDHEPWQHSSGPKSQIGKAISSQNARTHGCTSAQLLLPDEDPAEWDALKAAWLRDYSPDCDTFRDLVLSAATAQWFLRRNDKRLLETEQFLFTEAGPAAMFWLENQHRMYERILRYRTAAERAFLRARAAVEQYRRSRFLEQKESTRQQESQQRLARRKELDYSRRQQPEHSQQQQPDRTAASSADTPRTPSVSDEPFVTISGPPSSLLPHRQLHNVREEPLSAHIVK